MISPELLIKINADLTDFNKKMELVKKRTEDLSTSLNNVGLVAGVAFAGFGAIAIKTVDAFKEAKQASNKLEQSLKNQGIFSDELFNSYKNMAKELQGLVQIDDDLIISGQAVLQSFIGQNKITKELTLAVIDFAQYAKIDLNSAFALVGKTIGTKVNPLARQFGIEIADGLSISERMAVVTQKLTDKVGGQAKALADAKGPVEGLKVSFGNLLEAVGEKLEPMFDSFAGTLADITEYVNENDTALKAIGVTIAGGIGLAGLTLLVVGATQAFIVLEATAIALGVTLTALTGGLFAVVVGVGALIALVATADKTPKFKNLIDANAKLIEQKEKLAKYESQKKQGLAVDPEIQITKLKIDGINKQIKSLQDLSGAKNKAGSLTTGKEEIAQLEEKGRKLEALRVQKEADAKKAIEDAKKLKKDLVDAGKDEFTALDDLRKRRIQVAMGDKETLLLIEKDYKDKYIDLLVKQHDEELQLTQEKEEKIRKIKEDNLKALTEASANPFSVIGKEYKTEQEKTNAMVGAGVGVANKVAGGAEGARALVVMGAKAVADTIIPGLGEVAGPLLEAFTQGPEATRAMVKDFAQALPDIIEAFIEAIPVFIEEFANQIPVIIERLLEKLPEIIKSLVHAMPKVAVALALQMPKVALAFIKEIPNMAVSFVNSLVKEAPRFVTELIKSIGKGVAGPLGDIAGGIGGVLGDIGGFVGGAIGSIGSVFGFAEGGQFAKSVPSGFSNDTFPARLSSGELVVDRSTAHGLKEFIDGQNNNGGDINTTLLNKILSALSAPMNVETSVSVNQKVFADIILQLNRNNARLT
jgi:HPt (histidine-containing phosphotransfer) domain-containing protein